MTPLLFVLECLLLGVATAPVGVGSPLVEWEPPAEKTQQDASPSSEQVRRWYQDYMAAVNAHNVDRAMARIAPEATYRWKGSPLNFSNDDLRKVREWEVPMKAKFEFDVVRVQRECIVARHVESNLLNDALQVHLQHIVRGDLPVPKAVFKQDSALHL